jgi:uncharacterized UBP type Zn finger protein
MPEKKTCTHLDQIKKVHPKDITVCEDCIKTGDTWVNLRMCLVCGHVGCCDSSKNKHATKHFKEAGHPVMQSVSPGEEFAWCYVDEVFIEPVKL